MTEEEYKITKYGLLQIIQDTSQPARERLHAADTLLALEQQCGVVSWLLDVDSPGSSGG